jgi:hypothetical protein
VPPGVGHGRWRVGVVYCQLMRTPKLCLAACTQQLFRAIDKTPVSLRQRGPNLQTCASSSHHRHIGSKEKTASKLHIYKA